MDDDLCVAHGSIVVPRGWGARLGQESLPACFSDVPQWPQESTMQQPHVLHTPQWYYATTLAERVATLPTRGRPIGLYDRQCARRRLSRWHTQTPCTDSELFAQ